jgi:hypothetical protein
MPSMTPVPCQTGARWQAGCPVCKARMGRANRRGIDHVGSKMRRAAALPHQDDRSLVPAIRVPCPAGFILPSHGDCCRPFTPALSLRIPRAASSRSVVLASLICETCSKILDAVAILYDMRRGHGKVSYFGSSSSRLSANSRVSFAS